MRKKKSKVHRKGSLISEYTIASFIMHMIAEEEAEEEVTDPYEWRFDVRDGSQYNVDPWDYETEAEYYEALIEAIDNAWKNELSPEEEQVLIAYDLNPDDYASHDAFKKAVTRALLWRDSIDEEIKEHGELCGIDPEDYVLETDFIADVEINYDWRDYLDIEIENKVEEYGLDIEAFSTEEELLEAIAKAEQDEEESWLNPQIEEEVFDSNKEYPLFSDGYFHFYEIYEKRISDLQDKICNCFEKTPISYAQLEKGINLIKKVYEDIPVCLRGEYFDEYLVYPLKVSSSKHHTWVAIDEAKFDLINDYCQDMHIAERYTIQYNDFLTWSNEERQFKEFLQRNQLKLNKEKLDESSAEKIMSAFGREAFLNHQYNTFFLNILLAHHNATSVYERLLYKSALDHFLAKLYDGYLDYYLKLEKKNPLLYEYILEVEKTGPKFIEKKNQLLIKREVKAQREKLQVQKNKERALEKAKINSNIQDARLIKLISDFKSGIRWVSVNSMPKYITAQYIYPNGKFGDIQNHIATEYGKVTQKGAIEYEVVFPSHEYEAILLFRKSFDVEDNDDSQIGNFFKKYCLAYKLINKSYDTDDQKNASLAQKLVKDYSFEISNAWNKVYEQLVERGKTSSRWKSEQQVFRIVKAYYPDAEYQYRAEWLAGLILDIFIPSEKIAIEYQGIQHYMNIELFGGAEGLERRQASDAKKKKLCTDNDVKLIEIKYNELIEEQYILQKLRGVCHTHDID